MSCSGPRHAELEGSLSLLLLHGDDWTRVTAKDGHTTIAVVWCRRCGERLQRVVGSLLPEERRRREAT